jgi:hypothetical protein
MIPLAQDTIIGVWEPSFVANYNTKPYKSTQHQIDPKQENQKLPEDNTLTDDKSYKIKFFSQINSTANNIGNSKMRSNGLRENLIDNLF